MVELMTESSWEIDVEELRGGNYVTLLAPSTDNDRKCWLLRLPGGSSTHILIREHFAPIALQEVRDGKRPEDALVNLRIALDQVLARVE